MNWITLWPLVLFVTLGLFAVMAVLVTVLGARDIRRLLAHLRESPDSDSEAEETHPPTVS